MAIEKNLYDILGVGSQASADQIRTAYRALARQVHPDVNKSSQSSISMTELNHAWSVLSDPVQRREYDNSFKSPRNLSKSNQNLNFDDFDDQVVPPALLTPARFPWRSMLVAGILGSIFVLVAQGFSNPPAPGVPDQLLEVGSCVVVGSDRLAVEVACGGPHDYRVVAFIPLDRRCPADTETFRDRQGMGIACVQAVSPSTSVVSPTTPR